MSTFTRPPRVAFVVPDLDELQVFLMHLPDGPPFVLKGSAALIWLAAADAEPDVAAAVAAAVGLPRGEVVAEVEGYLAELVAKGLLLAGE